MTLQLRRWSPFALGIIILFGLLYRLDSVPPLWWDEGWTLLTARNWVELGHYGRLLDGGLAHRGLEATFPVTASIAVGFRLLGIGITQARFVAVIFTLASLALLYGLISRFYNQAIGIATLVVLIALSGHTDINVLIEGRQVLAEIPSLFFLLAGYHCFLIADKRPLLTMPAVICFWSLALLTKLQLQPFWAIAMLLPLLITMLQRQWRNAHLFAASFVGSLALHQAMQYLLGKYAPAFPIAGLTQTVALVLLLQTRLPVLIETLQFGSPTLLGLCWGLWSFLQNRNRAHAHHDLVRFSFLVLAGSWFAWYVTLSIGWLRYMFPPVFLGSVFVAAMLDSWTNHFNFAYTIEQAGAALRRLRPQPQNLGALVATVLIAMSVGQSMKVYYETFVLASDTSVTATAHFLNTATLPNARIETYESELLFLLNRRYHYPPDQIHLELIRRSAFGAQVDIDYDPLAADPDFIVTGFINQNWHLYDRYLTADKFELVKKFGRYEIYKRIRSGTRS
jgi:hypothetical protein